VVSVTVGPGPGPAPPPSGEEAGWLYRYRAEIWIAEGDGWVNLNDAIVAAGHAVYHDY